MWKMDQEGKELKSERPIKRLLQIATFQGLQDEYDNVMKKELPKT